MTQEELRAEYHEHPNLFIFFNGQWHWAVWVKTWASTGTADTVPDDAPVSCAICGRVYGN